MTKIKFFSLCTVLLSLEVFFPFLAQANFSVAPELTQILAKAGEKREVSLLITNASKQPAKVIVSAENWHVRHMGYHGELDDVNRWLTLEPREFVMAAESQGDYTFTVTIPKGLMDEEMAQVYFSFQPQEADQEAETPETPVMNIEQRIGVLVTIADKKTAQLKAVITDMDIFPTRSELGLVSIGIRFSLVNRGNIHAKPKGKLLLLKGEEQLAEVELRNVPSVFKGNAESYHLNFSDLSLEAGAYRIQTAMGVHSFDLWEDVEYHEDFELKE